MERRHPTTHATPQPARAALAPMDPAPWTNPATIREIPFAPPLDPRVRRVPVGPGRGQGWRPVAVFWLAP